jgi:hypothetical protein
VKLPLTLLSALRRLKLESIGESGKRTVGILGSSIYAGRTPEQFFSQCYSLGSKLVHGHVPRPTRGALNTLITELERFVADLLGALSLT